MKKTGFRANNIKSVPQKEVHFPSELVFPFAIARKTSINQMKPLASPSDVRLPADLPWGDEAGDAPPALGPVAPGPTPVAKGFQITPLRLFRYGETVGCKACERRQPSLGHTRDCRERFAELVARESKENVKPVPAALEAAPDPLCAIPMFPVGADGSLEVTETTAGDAPVVGDFADEGMLGVLIS